MLFARARMPLVQPFAQQQPLLRMGSSRDTAQAALDALSSYINDQRKAVSAAWLARDQGISITEATGCVKPAVVH